VFLAQNTGGARLTWQSNRGRTTQPPPPCRPKAANRTTAQREPQRDFHPSRTSRRPMTRSAEIVLNASRHHHVQWRDEHWSDATYAAMHGAAGRVSAPISAERSWAFGSSWMGESRAAALVALWSGFAALDGREAVACVVRPRFDWPGQARSTCGSEPRNTRTARCLVAGPVS